MKAAWPQRVRGDLGIFYYTHISAVNRQPGCFWEWHTYINLERDFGYKKLGPFSTFAYSQDDVPRLVSLVMERIHRIVGHEGDD